MWNSAKPHRGWRAAAARDSFATGPLVGTSEQIVERLTELEKIGMTYAINYFVDAAYDPASVALYERQVVPELS